MNFLKKKLSGFREMLYFSNWPILALGRLPLFNHRFAMYQKGKLNFISDYEGGDANGARQLLAAGIYKEFIDVILSKSTSINSLLDIGANNGGFILYLFQRLSFKIPKVVALEFNYRTYLRLQFNILYNTEPNDEITLIHGAASDVDGWLSVYDNFGSTGNSVDMNVSSDGEVKVPSITFDTLYHSNYKEDSTIDLCKIDIEGSEYEFLAENSSSNLSKVKYLLIEIHPVKKYNSQQLIDAITGRGFTLLIAGNSISPDVYLFEKN